MQNPASEKRCQNDMKGTKVVPNLEPKLDANPWKNRSWKSMRKNDRDPARKPGPRRPSARQARQDRWSNILIYVYIYIYIYMYIHIYIYIRYIYIRYSFNLLYYVTKGGGGGVCTPPPPQHERSRRPCRPFCSIFGFPGRPFKSLHIRRLTRHTQNSKSWAPGNRCGRFLIDFAWLLEIHFHQFSWPATSCNMQQV